MTSNLPTDPDYAPAEATAVMAFLLAGFGFPATAAAASFALGSLEHVGKGFLVALLVWAIGIGAAFVVPFTTGPAGGDPMPPALRWGLGAIGVGALALVVASSAPLLPWTLVLLVGPFFAWITGSLWIISRQKG
ncbi:hypothetical protein [Nocardioides stalactiti]|uniref:hypothetical protein n=1 Tax=Nocardioides stalactiti TaxID=2755356 RepID=UPI00160315E4|nr:hypothetical protein [Nocardioides stalactiti]